MDQTTQLACRTAVDEVRQRFEAWRKNRKLGSPIPDTLWDKAVQLARAHGVNPIARALHLDYYDLKRRTVRIFGRSGRWARRRCRSLPAGYGELWDDQFSLGRRTRDMGGHVPGAWASKTSLYSAYPPASTGGTARW